MDTLADVLQALPLNTEVELRTITDEFGVRRTQVTAGQRTYQLDHDATVHYGRTIAARDR